MDDLLRIIGRTRPLFADDLRTVEEALCREVERASFLVVGGAGSVGQEVVKQIFRRRPRRLHVVDISENNLVEVVRDLRSSIGYIPGDFQTLPLDGGSVEFDTFMADQEPYDYILNLSALKHVRSEKDPYTLMRMLTVNVLNTEKSLAYARKMGSKKYFAVSSDKAVNPVSIMGASKTAMELSLMRGSTHTPISTARFANVAFSDGSLLHGFRLRLQKRQPIAAPVDIKRYFITPTESGELCLLSCLLGENRDVFFPKPCDEVVLTDFPGIATRFLESMGYGVYRCQSEEEARAKTTELISKKLWPCYFFESTTSGEKPYEEFFDASETLDMARFNSIGVVKNEPMNAERLEPFLQRLLALRQKGAWTKDELLSTLYTLLPDFKHKDTHQYLDQRM